MRTASSASASLLLLALTAAVARADGPVPSFEWIAAIGPGWSAQEEPLRAPRGIDVSLDGRVFVADTGNQRVVAFDSLGGAGRAIGYAGTGEGRFVDPAGVATEGRHLYVLDEGNERVQIFNRHDVFSEVLLSREAGTIGIPSAIGVDLFGRLYVSDVEEDVVHAYRSYTGEEELVIGGYGTADGRFVSPGAIATDRERRVYVCDRGNGRVQVFDALGGWLLTFGNEGGEGALRAPAGIAVDRRGRVFVSDEEAGEIVVFSGDGSRLTEIREGPDGDPLDRPHGLAFGPTGMLYVVESGRDRILLLRPQPGLDAR